MGTKNNPGKFDCYANLEADEPYFLLRANDPIAPHLVRLWAVMYRLLKGAPLNWRQHDKALEAEDCAKNMEQWRENRDVEPSA